MMTHRDPLPGLREWISPRGYAPLGDDAPSCRGLCSRGLMQRREQTKNQTAERTLR